MPASWIAPAGRRPDGRPQPSDRGAAHRRGHPGKRGSPAAADTRDRAWLSAVGTGIKYGGLDRSRWGDTFRDRRFRVIARPFAVDVPALAGPSGGSAVDLRVRSLLAPPSSGSVSGAVSLSAVEPASLTGAGQRLASDLRAYAKIITHLKPGALPTGLDAAEAV
jgi:hypothetical protein